MKRYHLPVILIIFSLICLGMSCKKKKNDNPFGAAKIATFTQSHSGSILNYRMVYGNYNNIDSLIITGTGTSAGYYGFRKFIYFGTSYSITDETNATFDVLANSNGFILNVLSIDSLSMSYNGSQLMELDSKTPSSTPPYYIQTHTYFKWLNGDVTRDSTGGPAYTYDYDPGKYGQPGDAWRLDQFLKYGRSYIKTTHLVSDMMYGSTWRQNYFYQFDGNGRISQLIKVANNYGVGANDSVFYSITYY